MLDVVVEQGNPSDSTLACRTVARATSVLGRVPKQVSFDGGFSSKANVADIKAMGVAENLGRAHRVAAGIEAGISFLKRTFRLDRCSWSGVESFGAYVWGSVLSCNVLAVARHLLAT